MHPESINVSELKPFHLKICLKTFAIYAMSLEASFRSISQMLFLEFGDLPIQFVDHVIDRDIHIVAMIFGK
jgi:hypothetical protein